MKCVDCNFCKVLHPYNKEVGYCLAPAGRKKKIAPIKVNHKIERDCKLFIVKVGV